MVGRVRAVVRVKRFVACYEVFEKRCSGLGLALLPPAGEGGPKGRM